MGHAAGDELLAAVASRLNDEIRGSDRVARTQSADSDVKGAGSTGEAVARLGGDEFVVVLIDVEQAEDVALVARRVSDALSQSFTVQGKEVYVTASIGISLYPLDGEDSATLLKNADAAMYHAKNHGSGYEFFARHINESAAKRLALEGRLRAGLEQGEFSLHFQPRLDLRTGHNCRM